MKALEKFGSFLMGFLLVLAIIYGVIGGVMYIADWLRWLNIF